MLQKYEPLVTSKNGTYSDILRLMFSLRADLSLLPVSALDARAAWGSQTFITCKSTVLAIDVSRCVSRVVFCLPPEVFLLVQHPQRPRQEQAGEENLCDPLLTHHNVTLAHGMSALLPGSLSVSLCNQSRRHWPKSRGVAFCCGAEFKADRQDESERERSGGALLPPFLFWRKAWVSHELHVIPVSPCWIWFDVITQLK